MSPECDNRMHASGAPLCFHGLPLVNRNKSLKSENYGGPVVSVVISRDQGRTASFFLLNLVFASVCALSLFILQNLSFPLLARISDFKRSVIYALG